MPWNETDIEQEREKFINSWLTKRYTIDSLCKSFGISNKTGYKWLRRYKAEGMKGLADRSRAPRTQAQATNQEIVDYLLEVKVSYPSWGPRKVVSHLAEKVPQIRWPAHSTVSQIFDHYGLVKHRSKKRYKAPARTAPLEHATEPNKVWSVDFKGNFLLGDGVSCYPLTALDNCSRFLLECKGLHSTATEPVIKVFEWLFREYGLPEFVRSDNGVPFASTRIAGLSRFSLWLIKRGVIPERIQPGCPQENGRLERFHRSLKAATCNPAKGSLSAQQRAFNQYRKEYNQLRPHEALNDKTPSSVYSSSPRIYDGKEIEYKYPDHFEIRKVRTDGNMKWKQHPIYVANILAGEYIGLEPIDDGCWTVYLSTIKLGLFDERKKKIIRPGFE